MSPVASGIPPHTRATLSNGVGPMGATNGLASSNIDILKRNARKLPLLEDLLGARPDVNINTPFKTILQKGEELSRQADTNLDFRRPEIALQDYVKAAIIAVEILPKHKDFSALQDRPELNRLYLGLSKRINAQHLKFTAVKEAIKENNTVHGVHPTVETISTKAAALRLENVDKSHVRARSDQTAIPASKRIPPPVQPKPNALHGQAIHHTSNGSTPADLAARFARLRSPDQSPQVQDPRIRTQPIYTDSARPASARTQTSSPRPTGPRAMPSAPTSDIQPRIFVDVNMPGMPKAPDAIYSPDRGDESGAIPSLRSSASFTNVRKYSAPPISTVGPSPLLLDSRRDYFALASTANKPNINSLKRKEPSIPESADISPEDLMKYTGSDTQSLRVLLVDVRSREDFDSGHIMSQSIICVEPIALRQGMSGEELENTMIVAPDNEQELFGKRQDFDMLVVYDQDSTSVGGSSRNGSNSKLQDFMSAVYEYGYDKRLKRRPALLVGGLNGWIDLLGPNALQSSTSASAIKPHGKTNQLSSRALALRNSHRNDMPKRRVSRILSSQEQKLWETKLSSTGEESENAVAAEFSYAKTTEDFFRRYPEVHTFQQSMVSSPTTLTLQHQKLDRELQAMSPKPPTRPAPALPRQRSSGINNPRLVASLAHAAPAYTSLTNSSKPHALTGLANPLQTCYANSAIQALSATVFLRDLLKNFTYPPSPRSTIPLKDGETGTQCSQLMVRCLGNLLGHLWAGDYDYVAPSTFLEYVRSVDLPTKAVADRFALGTQQDSGEFYRWLIVLLDDELNPRRNVPEGEVISEVPDTKADILSAPDVGIASACEQAKAILSKDHQSPIAEHCNFITMRQRVCSNCQFLRRGWTTDNRLGCPAAEYSAMKQDGDKKNLTNYYKSIYGAKAEIMDDYRCDSCNKRNTTFQTMSISHFPEYLMIEISRFTQWAGGKGGDAQKNTTEIRFEDIMDLSACQTSIPEAEKTRPDQVAKYELYAIVNHKGAGRSGGHYEAYTRHLDEPTKVGGKPAAGSWHNYNDTRVTPIDDIWQKLAADQAFNGASMLFYRRLQA